MKKPLGFIIYDGPSLIDNNPIVCIVSGLRDKSENKKIGNMLQAWIIRRDVHPIDAANKGDNFSTCGSCLHRDLNSCYVNLVHGPTGVYHAFHRRNYEYFENTEYQVNLLKGKSLRIGAYGDPAAIPFEVWENFCKNVDSWTGYTHQWKVCDQRLNVYCMASCDTLEEKQIAQDKGWKTFRIRLENESLCEDEIVCPASKEGNKTISCSVCNCCNGLTSKHSKNPTIIPHGGGKYAFKVKNFIQGIQNMKNKKKFRRFKKRRNLLECK